MWVTKVVGIQFSLQRRQSFINETNKQCIYMNNLSYQSTQNFHLPNNVYISRTYIVSNHRNRLMLTKFMKSFQVRDYQPHIENLKKNAQTPIYKL